MNEHQNGYRVSWYDENGVLQQKYFFGPYAHGDAKLFKEYMDEKYPSRRALNILRKKSNRNKSCMVGVFRDDRTYTRKGKPYCNPCWCVSICVGPDGQKVRKTIRFTDRNYGSKDAAFKKACECRALYNQCIKNKNITAFYDEY